jgi:cbb3-type cytochrome oxidase subunit 3
MDINLLREIVTVASFGSFLAIVAYAVSPGNKKHFEEAARIPLDDDETALSPTLSPKGEGADALSPTLSPKGEGANVGSVFVNGSTN